MSKNDLVNIYNPFDQLTGSSLPIVREGDCLLWEYAPGKFSDCVVSDFIPYKKQIRIKYTNDNDPTIWEYDADPSELFYKQY